MDNELEDTIKKENLSATERPALISDPVVGRVGDQERFERRKATIERSRGLMDRKTEARDISQDDTSEKRGIDPSVLKKISSSQTKQAVENYTAASQTQNNSKQPYQDSVLKTQQEEVASGRTQSISGSFEKRNRVTFATSFLMIGTSILYDGIQIILALIPIVGWILSFLVGVFAWLTFYLWTKIKGLDISNGTKKIIIKWVTPGIELVPILNALPTWTLRTFLLLSTIKAEDTLYNASRGKLNIEKLTTLKKKVS